jgi:hypothetical protein
VEVESKITEAPDSNNTVAATQDTARLVVVLEDCSEVSWVADLCVPLYMIVKMQGQMS